MKRSRINLTHHRYNYLVLILFLVLVVLVLSPAEPVKTPVRAQSQVGQESGQAHSYANLSREQVAALSNLYQGLLAGQPFSEEEKYILNRFAAGVQISELEGQVITARVLYDYYVANNYLSQENLTLLKKYDAFCLAERHFNEDARAKVKADIKARNLAFSQNLKGGALPDAGPPANDDCTGAIAITDTQTYPITTTAVDVSGATTTGDPTMCGVNGNTPNTDHTIWYTFVPAINATYSITTCPTLAPGSTLPDTVLGVFTSTGACAGPFTTVGCNDDDNTCTGSTNSMTKSTVNVLLQAGTTYYIVVGRFNDGTAISGPASIQLAITRVPVPANDLCANATPLTLNTALTGQTTAGANDDYQLSGTTCFTGQGDNSVGNTASTANGRDVVYSFTAPAGTSKYSFRVTKFGTSLDPVLYLTTSCPSTGAVTCNSSSGPAIAAAHRVNGNGAQEIPCLQLSGSQTVFLFVDEGSVSDGSTSFTVEVSRCTQETEPNDTPATATIGDEGSIRPDGPPISITGASESGSTCTITTSGAHGFSPGQPVDISGVAVAGYNGFFIVATTPTSSSFTYINGTTGLAASSGGTVKTTDADFYALGTPPAGSRVFALVDGLTANSTDFDMRVTTTTDTLEYDNNDADSLFGSQSAVIGGTLLTGVPSYLLVSHGSLISVGTGPYRLYQKIQPPGSNSTPNCGGTKSSATGEIEPNDTAAQATSAVNNYFYGSLATPAPSTDVDYYSFTANVGDLIFLALDGDPCLGSPTNAALDLRNSADVSLIAVNDSDENTCTAPCNPSTGTLTGTQPIAPAEALVFRAAYTGTYYARVSAGSSDSFGAGDYLLSISLNNDHGPTAAPALISGIVSDGNGSPLGGVTVQLAGGATHTTITDSNGNYHFSNLESGQFYTVTPSLANYQFSPVNRSLSLVGDRTDAAFTGTADAVPTANAVDTTEYFVRQHYLDFLGREPDQGGFEYWSGQINQCNGDANCVRNRRIDVSASFFASPEFQQTGSYIYELYAGGLGRAPNYTEFMPDRSQVVGGPNLESARVAFADAFVQRPEFTAMYPLTLTRDQFVDALLQTMTTRSGTDVSALQDQMLSDYDAGGRSLAVRDAVQANAFVQAEYNKAFVLFEYFAYLRRNPDTGGYDFWLDVLNGREAGNYRGMVCAFITSSEYQMRFSSVVTHSNSDCSGVR